MVEALRHTGYHIALAFDALEGYRRATALRTDLILLDVRMGATNGFTACRLLKSDPATAHIPVIFITASAAAQDRLQGLRTGAVDYITKPFDPAEVLARVEIHLTLAERHSSTGTMTAPPVPLEDTPDEQVAPGSNMDRALVRAAERLIMANLGAMLPLRELAARTGTHEKRLSRAFKAHTGQTVFEFVREARLHEARRLLAGSAMRIEEIASAVGFSSAANFATAFRQHFDCTPSAYRQIGANPCGKTVASES